MSYNVTPILRAYKQGVPLELIAKQFGVSMHKVLDIVYNNIVKDK